MNWRPEDTGNEWRCHTAAYAGLDNKRQASILEEAGKESGQLLFRDSVFNILNSVSRISSKLLGYQICVQATINSSYHGS